VADQVFDVIREEKFYILTHPEWVSAIQLRTDYLLWMENPQNPGDVMMNLRTLNG
jgi:hypothetical protein